MDWAEGFIAVDWGTTNRRAYLLDRDGRCASEIEDDQGILSVERGQFAQSVEAIRSKLGNRPMLLAGMIGSNRGWVEAPYVPCPAAAEDVAERLVPVEQHGFIVPGVSYRGDGRSDVMRGEEIQIFGAVADGMIPSDCLICHPGTHNKWIALEQGKIASFRTVMTGEIFNLLREHSILSDQLAEPASAGDAFADGVRRGLHDEGLTAELFLIRARALLGDGRKDDASSFASGLLIGADLRIGLRGVTDDRVFVMGRPELTKLYAAALRQADREPQEIDGEKAFLAGARKIVELIE